MQKPSSELETVHPDSRSSWRKWLHRYHDTSPGVWLVFDKQSSGRRRLSYNDAVEEALCFGWIDSRVNAIDEHRYRQMFTPRKAKSVWSKLNKSRIERLIEQGLMAPAGMEKIEIAKRNGSWSLLDGIEELRIPDDLDAAFKANPTARQHFMAFSPSSRKGLLWWIESARRPETRARRIEETVKKAAENLKANQ